MKKLFLFFFTCSLHGAVFGYVQSASQSGNTALAFPSNNTAGNAIVVFTSVNSSLGLATAVNDTQGNTYTNLMSANGQPAGNTAWIARNIKAGANSVTATGLNASGAGSSIAIFEITTPATSAYAVLTCQTFNGGTNPFGCAAVNTNNFISPGELFVLISCYDFATSHAWTGTNLTIQQTTTESGPQTMGVGQHDFASIAAGTVSEILGCSNTSSGRCGYVGVSLVSVAGASGAPSVSPFVGEN